MFRGLRLCTPCKISISKSKMTSLIFFFAPARSVCENCRKVISALSKKGMSWSFKAEVGVMGT